MPVQLQFLNMNNEEIDLGEGLDLGVSRKGRPVITPIKIKNVGNITARDIILEATTLNEQNEVDEVEYANQLKAASWKSFSLDKDGEYVKELRLGDLKPNRFIEGYQTLHEKFENSTSCMFKEVWCTGVSNFQDNHLVLHKNDYEEKGAVARRMKCETLARPRDLEMEFKLSFEANPEEESLTDAMIVFPVRINSKGDGNGYIFIVTYRRADNKFMVNIYKNGKGMESNNDRVYGTKIFDTVQYRTFDTNKKIGLKIYNDSNNVPTFEVLYNGQNLPLANADGTGTEESVKKDNKSDAFIAGGDFFMDCSIYDGDIALAISEFKVKTENLEQPIYVKTIVGDDADDKMEYRSSLMVGYIEE